MQTLPDIFIAPRRAPLGMPDARLASASYTALRDEMIDALLIDPEREVRTPGFCDENLTATEVVRQDIAEASGEPALHELLRMVADAAKGEVHFYITRLEAENHS